MIATKCFVCGSSSIRADRALSGRLVCNSCGNPIGVKRRGGKIYNYNNFSFNKKFFLFFIILIIAFILVII